MPKRFYKETRKLIVQFLWQRGPHECIGCGKAVEERELEIKGKIDIHHVDGNDEHNEPLNLQLWHHACNAKEFQKRLRVALNLLPLVEREGENVKRQPTPMPEDGYAPNKNRVSEPEFRRWCFVVLKAAHAQDREVERQTLVRDGAAWVGNSMQADYHYLAKLLSPMFGPFKTEKSKGAHGIPAGENIIIFKLLEDYSLGIEELERKYPYEGVRSL